MNTAKKNFCLLALVVCFFLSSLYTTQAAESTPFTGEPGYRLRHEHHRDRSWERFAVHVAEFFLSGHPILSGQPGVYMTAEDYVEWIRIRNLEIPRPTRESDVSFTDAEIRASFIDFTENLIQGIPQSEDYRILYGLSELVALIGNTHSVFFAHTAYQSNYRFPFRFEFFADGVFIVSAPYEYEWALGKRLDKINGFTIGEIITLLAQVIGHHTIHIVHYVAPWRELTFANALRYVGVMESENYAIYTLTDSEGEEHVIIAEAVTSDLLQEIELAEWEYDTDLVKHRNPGLDYFYEYIPDVSILYIRYRSAMHTRRDMRGLDIASFGGLADMITDVIETVQKQGGVERFIIDLRGNRGGWVTPPIINLIDYINENRQMFGEIYVAIDRGTHSAAVMIATLLKTQIENVTLIGEPAGQPPNFITERVLGPETIFSRERLTGVRFARSSVKYIMWPDYPYETLMPDIYIPRYFADIRNNFDAVLEYIKAR